jgi:hypothetical protein
VGLSSISPKSNIPRTAPPVMGGWPPLRHLGAKMPVGEKPPAIRSDGCGPPSTDDPGCEIAASHPKREPDSRARRYQ